MQFLFNQWQNMSIFYVKINFTFVAGNSLTIENKGIKRSEFIC